MSTRLSILTYLPTPIHAKTMTSPYRLTVLPAVVNQSEMVVSGKVFTARLIALSFSSMGSSPPTMRNRKWIVNSKKRVTVRYGKRCFATGKVHRQGAVDAGEDRRRGRRIDVPQRGGQHHRR